MIRNTLIERQLPHGVADLYFEDAAIKSRVESQLRDTFSRWSYTQVIPPTFEYYESLAAEASPQVREEIYRFTDRDGRMLALRADPTIPIARLVSTRLRDYPLPLRFYYIENVFRYEEPKAALRREFTQAGIELIGAGAAAADAEVIALAVSALRAVGLQDFRVRLGAIDFVQALLAELGLSESQFETVKSALERKNEFSLGGLLRDLERRPDLQCALAALPHLTGDVSVLDRAENECAVNAEARTALERLRAVWRYLQGLGCVDAITFDLAMVRGMAYYTGLVFEGFARGIGFAIMSGGRYDHLLAHFGRDLPAMGFAIGVERALAALDLQGGVSVKLAPEVVAELAGNASVDERIVQARGAGRRVETYVGEGDRAALRDYARARGARQVWFADGTDEVLA